MSSILHSGIIYARANSANLAIARLNSGLGGDLTDVIASPTVETGTITASTGSATVTGSGTTFTSDLEGQYLYAYNVSNEPVLVGLVETVGSTTSLTLTANGSSAATAKAFGVSFSLITTIEPVIVAVPSNAPNATSTWIPDYTQWRVSPKSNPTTFNDVTISVLEQYTDSGSTLAIDGTPANIPFTVEPTQLFTQGNDSTTYWQRSNDLPTWTFAILNPYGSQPLQMASNTMFRWRTQELLPSILVSPGTLKTVVSTAGYPPN
jgi:hypothetical protein